MTFAISASAMAAGPSLGRLDGILNRVEDGVHKLEIKDADVLEASAWYQTRPERQMLLRKCALASVYEAPRTRGPHSRRVEVPAQLTSEQAYDLAHTPLRILLENDNSDGALVKFAVRAYGSEDTWGLCFGDLAQATPKAVEVESRGGFGELKKLIHRPCEEAQARAIAPRLVVMTDSDGEWVGDIKDHAKEIHAECKTLGIPCAPLGKRTAENYVPAGVWTAWYASPRQNKVRPAIQALLRLTQEQQDYVRFESSDTAPWDNARQQVADLYQGVDDRDFDLLKRTSLKAAAAAALAFALQFDTPWDEADVRSRDRAGDLARLVQQIEEEL